MLGIYFLHEDFFYFLKANYDIKKKTNLQEDVYFAFSLFSDSFLLYIQDLFVLWTIL